MNKAEIRKRMMNLRRQLPDEKVIEKSLKIMEHLFSLDVVINARLIMTYVDANGEVRTREIIKHALEAGKRIAVPVCVPEKGEIMVSEIFSLNELVPGHYGIMEPKKECIRPVDVSKIDVVLIPGLAFDLKGNRIGYGKGYYDRFLGSLESFTVKIALAYEFQVLEEVPFEHFDVAVDYIITERKVYGVID